METFLDGVNFKDKSKNNFWTRFSKTFTKSLKESHFWHKSNRELSTLSFEGSLQGEKKETRVGTERNMENDKFHCRAMWGRRLKMCLCSLEIIVHYMHEHELLKCITEKNFSRLLHLLAFPRFFLIFLYPFRFLQLKWAKNERGN